MQYIELCQHDLYGHTRKFNHVTGKFEDPGIQLEFHSVDDVREMGKSFALHNKLVEPALGFVLCRVADNNLICEMVASNCDSEGA